MPSGNGGILTVAIVNEGFVKSGADVPTSDTSASGVAVDTSCV